MWRRYGHLTPGEIVLDDSAGTLGIELFNQAFDGRGVTIRILCQLRSVVKRGYATVLGE